MTNKILYNDINLPEKVSDILELDFWILEHVAPAIVNSVKNPVKFSAFTSIFVHKGCGEADINLITHKIQAPCIINVACDDIVLPRNISDDFDASFIVMSKNLTATIATTIKDLSVFSIIHTHPVLEIDHNVSTHIHQLYNDLKDIAASSHSAYQFESILFTILSYFYRFAVKQYEHFRSNITQSLSSSSRIPDKYLRLVQEHFRKERFLDFYADRLGISTKHLSRTIKMHTGVSAVEWINRFVILEAKVMLRSSNLNIQQIAEELNFPSQSFFGKYFKKATGLSPKDFRNML
ncbi:MAG: helix-turn-helix domain-containing protein [Muribaculaceae bacterium]|nr:helix-turn-helix domain-containing protein [Muribaculaceae bacterium]